VAVALIDGKGTLISGPISVADGVENVGGCDLAWSGEALLVAWWDIALDQPRSAPEHSIINARLVSLH
jgi:hypothetical protein